jgi:hypothetical protein
MNDFAPHIEQRAARVTRVDSRVGLDEVLVEVAQFRKLELTASLTLMIPEVTVKWVAAKPLPSAEHPLADPRPVTLELGHDKTIGVDFHDGDVGEGIGAHHLGSELAMVGSWTVTVGALTTWVLVRM